MLWKSKSIKKLIPIGMFFALAGALYLSAAEVPSKSARQSWYESLYIESYKNCGLRDQKWDADVTAALVEYVRLTLEKYEGNARFTKSLSPYLGRALDAGCKDPLVQYLHLRFIVEPTATSTLAMCQSYENASRAIDATEYPPWIKCFAAMRAAEFMKGDYGAAPTPRVLEMIDTICDHFGDAVADQQTPTNVIDESLGRLIAVSDFESSGISLSAGESHKLSKALGDNWDGLAVTHWYLGECHERSAWCERGNGYAKTVTKEGWAEFSYWLDEAAREFKKASAIDPGDPRSPTEMITVKMGQGAPFADMETWFLRAMKADPNYVQAARAKLLYLEPKWEGSEEEMVAFGRLCATSGVWGGYVPFMLKEAHERIASYLNPNDQAEYLRRPEVREDVKTSFTSYFKRYPMDDSIRYEYAAWDYRAEQWEDFLSQIQILKSDGSKPFYVDFFGGTAKFDEMVRTAEKHLNVHPIDSGAG